MAVRAAMPSWFRLKMKLDPKANDRVRSSWRLRKSIPSSFRKERGPRHDTCADGVLGSVKTRFWAICRQSGSNPDGDMRVASVPGGRLVGSDLRALHRSWTDYELSRTDLWGFEPAVPIQFLPLTNSLQNIVLGIGFAIVFIRRYCSRIKKTGISRSCFISVRILARCCWPSGRLRLDLIFVPLLNSLPCLGNLLLGLINCLLKLDVGFCEFLNACRRCSGERSAPIKHRPIHRGIFPTVTAGYVQTHVQVAY